MEGSQIYAKNRIATSDLAAQIQIEVVDIACGTVRFSSLMMRLCYDVVGVDVSREMLNIAKEKIKARLSLLELQIFVFLSGIMSFKLSSIILFCGTWGNMCLL